MSQQQSSVMKTIIGLTALFALVAGVWFGIHQSEKLPDQAVQPSLQQLEAEVLESAKAAKNHLPAPEEIKNVAFLLTTKLQDTQSDIYAISEKLSKVTLVNFWATWCAPCREEMPVFNAVFQKYQDKGFGVLGLTIDNSEATEAFIQQLGITYPILMAEQEGWDLLSKTGNPKNLMPYSFLIDKKGLVLEKKLGPLHAEELEAWVNKYL